MLAYISMYIKMAEIQSFSLHNGFDLDSMNNSRSPTILA